jgi:hypothetical protein
MSFSTVHNLESVEAALGTYCLTGLVILAGIAFGEMVVEPSRGPHSPGHVAASDDALVDTLTKWDGQWYLEIAQQGYTFDPERMSSVAFFPTYPILVRTAAELTRMPLGWAALLVSHAFLLAALVLLFAYVRRRFAGAPAGLAPCVLLAMALFPPTLFMRMAYSESLFLFLTILAVYGMEQNWRLWVIAAVVGFATATRLTGVALLLPLAVHIWRGARTARRAAAMLAAGMPLALGGLFAFILYQQLAFGAPLAFVRAQHSWRHRPPEGLFDKTLALASWEPVWSAYVPSSAGYVGRIGDAAPAVLSLQFANPLFFVGAVGLVFMGLWKGWLSRSEILLSVGLILIPYAGKGFEMCMASQGRFVAAVFPIYLVVGNLISRSAGWAVAILGLFAAYLAVYSTMLAAGYILI